MRRGSNAASWRELADLLGIGEPLVKRAILSGELPGYKIGKRYVVPRDAFEAVANGTWKPTQPPALPGARTFVARRRSA